MTESVTGRDGYIVAKALYQAIKYQDQLKKADSTFYEWSDQQDMKAILHAFYEPLIPVLAMSDQDPPDLTDEKVKRKSAKKA